MGLSCRANKKGVSSSGTACQVRPMGLSHTAEKHAQRAIGMNVRGPGRSLVCGATSSLSCSPCTQQRGAFSKPKSIHHSSASGHLDSYTPTQLLPVSHEERPICLPADAPTSTWPVVAFLLSLALCASCQSNSPGLHPPVLTCTARPSSLAPWSIFLALRADPPPPPIPSLSFLSRIVSEHL